MLEYFGLSVRSQVLVFRISSGESGKLRPGKLRPKTRKTKTRKPKTRKPKTRKTKTRKTKTRKTKTLFILVLKAIPGPFKKAQKYNKQMRRKSGLNNAQSSKSAIEKNGTKKPCIPERNIMPLYPKN